MLKIEDLGFGTLLPHHNQCTTMKAAIWKGTTTAAPISIDPLVAYAPMTTTGMIWEVGVKNHVSRSIKRRLGALDWQYTEAQTYTMWHPCGPPCLIMKLVKVWVLRRKRYMTLSDPLHEGFVVIVGPQPRPISKSNLWLFFIIQVSSIMHAWRGLFQVRNACSNICTPACHSTSRFDTMKITHLGMQFDINSGPLQLIPCQLPVEPRASKGNSPWSLAVCEHTL